MIKQTVLWTTLPYAVSKAPGGDLLHLSVFLSPQLWCDEPISFLHLGAFPDFLDLPSKIGPAAFAVEFDGVQPLAATRAPLDPAQHDEPDPQLWKALFDAGTIVLPYAFPDYTERALDSYSAIALLNYVRDLYQRVGSDPVFGKGAEYPPLDALAGNEALRAIESAEHQKARAEKAKSEAANKQEQQDAHNAMINRRRADFEAWKPVPAPPSVGDRVEPARYTELFARDPFQEIEGDAPTPESPVAPVEPAHTPPTQQMKDWAAAFDAFRRFHQPFSSHIRPLLSQTDLVKKLQDKTITPSELAHVFDFHRAIALLAGYPRLLRLLGLVVDLTVPRDPAIPASGLVRIVARWKPSLPTLNDSLRTAYTLDSARFRTASTSKDNTLSNGLLHLRNSGCVIAQVDVDGAAFKLSNLAADLQDAVTTPGASGDSSSLPALRSGGIALLRPDPVHLLHEKFSTSKKMAEAVERLNRTLTASNPVIQNTPRADESDVVFAEALVRGYRVDVFDDSAKKWRSLHRRAGTYSFLKPQKPFKRELTDEGFTQLSATQAPDDSSPELRVHEALAVWEGWSLAAPKPGMAIANPPGDAQESNQNRSGTELGLEVHFTPEKGSLPRLRFGHNYRLRVRAVDLAGNSAPFDPNDTNASLAEAMGPAMHRRFEPISSPFLVPGEKLVDGESLERMVIRSGAARPAETCERRVVPPKSAQFLAELHQKFDDGRTLKRGQDGYDLAVRERGTLKDGITPLPYLPDPFARGAVLLGLPGLAPSKVIQDVNKIEFTGEFPNSNAFRLSLQDGDKAPNWDPSTRTLQVWLPPGETARIRLSSHVTADDLKQMGVWQWIQESNPSNLADLQQNAQDGQHWMITPYRTLVLVHAVTQPIVPPKFGSLAGDRMNPSESFATIAGSLAVDRKSTAHVDVLAEWSDLHDDPSNPGNDPTKDVETHHSPLGGVHVPFSNNGLDTGLGVISASTDPVTFQLRHDLRDTKYHHVKYSAKATTRFRDYFATELEKGTLQTSQITRDMEEADRKELDIASSTRPAAPRVVYVVPSFQWTTTGTLPSVRHELAQPDSKGEVTRRILEGEFGAPISEGKVAPPIPTKGEFARTRSGGLRVYLERPWFSSGDGELLGVVFQQTPSFSQVSALARPRVTQWGADPLWSSAAPPSSPLYDHFKGFVYPSAAVATDTSTLDKFTLDEMSEPVSVAAYPVEYDAARGLWFADIEIEFKPPESAYFPFVRLALARCQPHSLPGVELSRVVLADFAQLAPDRTLTVKWIAESPEMTTMHITLNGVANQTKEPPLVGIKLQQLNPDIPSDLGWQDVPQTSVEIEREALPPALWSGQVTVHGDPSVARRLVILEGERLGDGERVIYADLIQLPLK